jgi:hypothetical protein
MIGGWNRVWLNFESYGWDHLKYRRKIFQWYIQPHILLFLPYLHRQCAASLASDDVVIWFDQTHGKFSSRKSASHQERPRRNAVQILQVVLGDRGQFPIHWAEFNHLLCSTSCHRPAKRGHSVLQIRIFSLICPWSRISDCCEIKGTPLR